MIELVRYHTWHKGKAGYESAVRSAFIKRGRKWIKVLCIDATTTHGMRLWKVPMSEEKYMTPLLRKGTLYPVKRALTVFRHAAKIQGITKGGHKLLQEVTKQYA